MIVGHGMLARAFAARYADDPEVTIFASGVSNSGTTDEREFVREWELLDPLLAGGTRLVYFGSCGSAIGNAEAITPYMRHKRTMEERVAGSRKGMVLRLPQVVGKTRNPNTLTNFLYERIVSGSAFTVWANAERNLIDVDDVAAIGTRMIDDADADGPRIFSVASARSVPMPELVDIFERVLGRRARYDTQALGAPLRIEANRAQAIAAELGIDLGDAYVETVIRKYYESRA